MYEYIKGIFAGINKDYIIVDNNGIGYKIHTSGSTISKMPAVNDKVTIYTQQIVREDFIGLYGFLTKEEINMFNILLTINGVGAKAALSLLSICSVENLQHAIINEDEKTIVRAPGIGKKTAQRIILELRDKIKVDNKDAGIKDISQIDEISNKLSEALSALISLGYSEKEAKDVLRSVSSEDTIENIIKNCLKKLMSWGELYG